MRKLGALIIALLVVSVSAAVGADSFSVHIVSQTNSTITLGWDPQPGYGYLFSAEGQLVSRTSDPSRSTVKFAKNSANSYDVDVIVKGANGHCCEVPNPGDTQPPTAPTNLRSTSVTQTTATIAWDASTDNVGVTNYRIYRNGSLIGQGAGSSGGFTDAWSDSGLLCSTNYTYGVEAQDNAGNTSTRTLVAVTTSTCDTPPPPPGSGTTITTAQLEAACNVAGAVIDSVTVSGSSGVSCGAQNVSLRNSKLSGFVLDIDPGASGFRLDNTDITNGGFNIWGADNVTIVDGAFDGGGRVSSNQMWDNPARNGVNGFLIARNSFSNYRGGDCGVHGEALFIGGYSANGVIENNTFSNNGCTSHVFFSYFGSEGVTGYNSAQVPRNVCVRGNTFGSRFLNTYYDVNFRQEVAAVGPVTSQIKIQPNAVTTNPEFNAAC